MQVWATATIAALVAGPGLGRVITDGFFRTNYGKGIAGARGRGWSPWSWSCSPRRQRLVAPRTTRRHGSSPKRDSGNVGGPVYGCRRADDSSDREARSCSIRTRVATSHGTQKEHMSIRRSLAAVLSVGTLFLATACAGDDLDSGSTTPTTRAPRRRRHLGVRSASTSAGGALTLAGQNFPEATLVASMYQQLLEKAGYDVDVKLVDTRDGYMADFPGERRHRPGVRRRHRQLPQHPDERRQRRRRSRPATAPSSPQHGQALLDDAGITLLDPSAATDTNAFMVTKDYSDENGVTKLSDLEGKSVTLAAAPDCEGRLDCEGGLSDQYGIDITEVLPLGYASDQTYQSVINGESELGETSTTDGTLESQGLVVLEDDKQIQPAQNLVPAVSTEFLTAHPDVADILNPLMAALTTENLTELNGKIAVDREKPEDVAKEFLTENGLL